jgi:hypothetical protein
MQLPNACFLFGSNRSGLHGAGAARDAVLKYDAEYGKGEGAQGRSYALPTKDARIKTLPIPEIARHVDRFLTYARQHEETLFVVTRVGCGLAGYQDAEIAPLFKGAPANCRLPIGWRLANNEPEDDTDDQPQD